jgi:capsular exopolysaccharide synthesis family protein
VPHDDLEELTEGGKLAAAAALGVRGRVGGPFIRPFFGVGETEPDEPAIDLRIYWDQLWRRRWLMAAVFAAVLALGVIGTLTMTPIYRANALLQIDREAPKVLNNSDTLQPAELSTGDEFFQTEYGLLKSSTLASRVAASLGLANDRSALQAMGWRPSLNRFAPAQDQARRDRDVVVLFEKHLKVEPVRGSRLVQVGFESRDPRLSARIANAMAENFITSNLERRFQAASYARQYLEQQLAQVKTRLEDSEKAAVAYASQQQIINIPVLTGTNSGGNQPTAATESLVAADLATLNQALAVATNQRILAEQKWRQAKTTPGQSLPDVIANPTVQQLLQERAKVGAEYQQKLATYKPDHPTMLQLKSQLNEIDRAINAQVSHTQDSLSAQYQTALNQESSLKTEVDQLKRGMIDLSNRNIQYNILQREVDTNRSLYDGLLQRYKEVGVAGGVGTNNVSIVDLAQPPLKPTIPNVPLYVAGSTVLGLLLAVMAAFAAEAFDQGVGSPSDVESKLSLRVVGSVPILARGTQPPQALRDAASPFSEAFNSMRTLLQFSTSDGAPRSILITSSRAGEGKSTCALGLAESFARLGGRVLLVDGDLRDPTLHRNVGANNATGLSKFLAGSAAFADVVQATDIPNLSLVPCGPIPPGPSELLAGVALRDFLSQASDAFDLVIVDGPPVVGLSDALSISSAVVGTLFVIEAAAVRGPYARAAIRRLMAVDARIVGAILSKYDGRGGGYGYDYKYHYAYGSRGRRRG